MWKRLKKYYYGWKYKLLPTHIRLLALAAANSDGVPPKEVFDHLPEALGLRDRGLLRHEITLPVVRSTWTITSFGWKVLEAYAE